MWRETLAERLSSKQIYLSNIKLISMKLQYIKIYLKTKLTNVKTTSD